MRLIVMSFSDASIYEDCIGKDSTTKIEVNLQQSALSSNSSCTTNKLAIFFPTYTEIAII